MQTAKRSSEDRHLLSPTVATFSPFASTGLQKFVFCCLLLCIVLHLILVALFAGAGEASFSFAPSASFNPFFSNMSDAFRARLVWHWICSFAVLIPLS